MKFWVILGIGALISLTIILVVGIRQLPYVQKDTTVTQAEVYSLADIQTDIATIRGEILKIRASIEQLKGQMPSPYTGGGLKTLPEF